MSPENNDQEVIDSLEARYMEAPVSSITELREIEDEHSTESRLVNPLTRRVPLHEVYGLEVQGLGGRLENRWVLQRSVRDDRTLRFVLDDIIHREYSGTGVKKIFSEESPPKSSVWLPVKAIAGLCFGLVLLSVSVTLFVAAKWPVLESVFLVVAGAALIVPAIIFMMDSRPAPDK